VGIILGLIAIIRRLEGVLDVNELVYPRKRSPPINYQGSSLWTSAQLALHLNPHNIT
jgi:hypothetical protein